MNRFNKPHIKYGAAAIIITGIFALLFVKGMAFGTEDTQNSLCISCHEMKETVYKEYLESAHNLNPSGVRATCNDCHLPAEIGPKAVRKIQAVREVVSSFKGTIDTPEKFEENRLRMAKSVWAYMEETDSRECRTCHAETSFAFGKFKNPKEAKRMKKGLEEGQTCISCHKGVAHAMPDMSSGYKAVYKELKALSKDEKKKPGKTYVLSTKPFFLDKEGGKKAGKLLPGTELTLVRSHGKMLEVRIDGWQQDGVDAIIYGLMGKRIFSATVKKKARKEITREKTVTDPDTDIVWHRVSLTAFIKPELTIASKEKLWSYGTDMWSASCSSCHSATPPDHFTANLWIGNLKSMKPQLSLTREEYRFLQAYLQFHASDTGGTGH